MRRYGVFTAGSKEQDHGPADAGGAALSGALCRPEAIENRDAVATHRGQQDLGAITSQKVVAQGDQVTSLNKEPRVNGSIQSSPDDIS